MAWMAWLRRQQRQSLPLLRRYGLHPAASSKPTQCQARGAKGYNGSDRRGVTDLALAVAPSIWLPWNFQQPSRPLWQLLGELSRTYGVLWLN